MTTVPAICPACAQVLQVDIETLPEVYTCPHCGAELTHQLNGVTVAFFPVVKKRPEREEVLALLEKAEAQPDPKKKHKLLQEAIALDPESYQANLALLMLGKLYERDRRPGDYRMIKCYLLHMFEEPGQHSEEERAEMVRELTADPLLLRVMALSADEQAFWREYLGRLSMEYLNVFVKGRNGISRLAFGIPRSGKDVARGVAAVTRVMIRNVSEERQLEALQRQQLRDTLRETYLTMFPEYPDFLRDA